MSESIQHQRLCELLSAKKGVLKIALSGGIDSITLMTVAARVRTEPTIALHAVSAAVPDEATVRCRELASRYGWPLDEIDAHEFDNAHYIANPVNRCYYCKSSLFDRIMETTHNNLISSDQHYTIATGTNTDDLGDYRPGLIAARERDVWQPYVAASIDKKTIRLIAQQEGLGKLSELPAQPCLSSRVETGIAINVKDLGFIHRVETSVTRLTQAGDIRCRITQSGVTVQLPADNEIFQNNQANLQAEELVWQLCREEDRIFNGFEPYRMGSAFLKNTGVVVADV